MDNLAASVDRVAGESGFSGVVRVDAGGKVLVDQAYGWAQRAERIPNRPDTRLGVASAVKGLTALTVVSLVADGVLALDTPARTVLGSDLSQIDDDVTVEQLLAHRSGIGDYLDEDILDDINAYVLGVGAHELVDTEDFLRVLDGYPMKFPAGQQFSYCNGGYVVLALIAERAAGTPFPDLVEQRVCGPAGMRSTAFLRSDELPANTAFGYLDADGPRTNVFHLPVRGTGDGGIYSTTADFAAFWRALHAGEIVPLAWVERMMAARSDVPSLSKRYGLGFWLHESLDVASLDGFDAGVSARSVHDPSADVTYTVIGNTSAGAWPVARHLAEAFGH